MAFQSSAFQPPPKPSRSEKIRGFGRAVRTLVLPPKGVPLLEESAWQRGKREGGELANRRAIQFMIVCAPIFAVGGLFFALPGFWWPLRVLLAALIGLGVAVVAALVVAGYYALRAPYGQRDEARNYARALGTHVDDYAEWARRREIADDFRRETLELARSVSEGNWHQSASDLETHWRTNAAAVQSQLREYGAGADITDEIDRQLAALEARDDGYGDDQIRRVVNNMQTACQNVWTMTRAADQPPTAPIPPTDGNG
jgi:hypothetical protein